MQIGRAVQRNVLAGQSRLESKSTKQQHARADEVLVSGATLDYARTCGCKEAMSSKPSKHSKRSKQIHQEATRLASRPSEQQHARTRAVNILAQFIGHWKKMTRQSSAFPLPVTICFVCSFVFVVAWSRSLEFRVKSMKASFSMTSYQRRVFIVSISNIHCKV